VDEIDVPVVTETISNHADIVTDENYELSTNTNINLTILNPTSNTYSSYDRFLKLINYPIT